MVFLSHFVLVNLEIFFVLNNKFFCLFNVFVAFGHPGFKMAEGSNFGFEHSFLLIHFIIQRRELFCSRYLVSVNMTRELIQLDLNCRGVFSQFSQFLYQNGLGFQLFLVFL